VLAKYGGSLKTKIGSVQLALLFHRPRRKRASGSARSGQRQGEELLLDDSALAEVGDNSVDLLDSGDDIVLPFSASLNGNALLLDTDEPTLPLRPTQNEAPVLPPEHATLITLVDVAFRSFITGRIIRSTTGMQTSGSSLEQGLAEVAPSLFDVEYSSVRLLQAVLRWTS
jgi:hypothetical protein